MVSDGEALTTCHMQNRKERIITDYCTSFEKALTQRQKSMKGLIS